MLSTSLQAGRVCSEYLSLTNHDHESRVHFQIWGRLSIFHLDRDPGAALRPHLTHTHTGVCVVLAVFKSPYNGRSTFETWGGSQEQQ